MRQIIAILLVIFLAACAAPAQQVAVPKLEPQPASAPAVQTAEPAPAQTAPQPAALPGPTTAADPVMLKQGEFHRIAYHTDGRVSIHRKIDGTLIMDFTGFKTTPGAGLSVVLHSGDPANGFVVGGLISASGNYPYKLPDDLEVNKYHKVAIYQAKNSLVYGEADLR